MTATEAAESKAVTGFTMYPRRLAAPFIRPWGWEQVPTPTPNGYWVTHRLNNDTGGVVLQMGSLGSHQQNPLIGWTWAGWKKPGVYARGGDSFLVVARTGTVTAEGYGGQTVPRVFASLHPEGGGRPIESSVVIGSNRTHYVSVTAPYSGRFTLHAEFNIRSVRSGYAYPYCRIEGTLNPVIHWFRGYAPGTTFAGVADEELPEDVAQLLQPEEREFTDGELAEQLALLEKEPGIEIPDGPEAFAETK